MSIKTLIVGLGNPKYSLTRHNIGSDILGLYLLIKNVISKKHLNQVSLCIEYNSLVFLTCPDIMNISGQKIHKIYKKYKCNKLIVLVDDLELKLGKVKIHTGSSRGHNGIKSILNYFKDFQKILIGIDRPKDRDRVPKYVLEKFEPEEMKKFHQILLEVTRILNIIMEEEKK